MNVVGTLHDLFHRPIWITEFGTYGADKASLGATDVKMMDKWNAIATQYDIVAGQIYELLDQSEQSGIEAVFGIYDSNGNTTAASNQIKTFLTEHPGGVVY